MSARDNLGSVRAQLVGQAVDQLNVARWQSCAEAQLRQDSALAEAMHQIEKVRTFLGTPENILGSAATKHGEIAEAVEVAVHNANAILEHQLPGATFDGIGRTSPIDYQIDGVDFQSKFINGTGKGLGHVLEHASKYPDFAPGGGKYHIPKDQFELIQKILDGEQVENLNAKSVAAILRKVKELEAATGQPFEEVVKPGVSTYAEVQQGAVHGTLDEHDQKLEEKNSELKEEIDRQHEPSLSGMAQAAVVGGGIAAGVGIGVALYRKAKSGKNVFKGELTAKDWQEVGLSGAAGFAGGAVTGGAIYAMTNYAGMSAPLAGAIISAAKGIQSLCTDLRANEIDGEQFIEAGLIVCSESAMVALATVAGQAVIPVPVLGAVVGAISGRMLSQLSVHLSKADQRRLDAEMQSFLADLTETHQALVRQIDRAFESLGTLTEIAFNVELNLGLVLLSSSSLAHGHGVEKGQVLRSIADVDDFMFA